MIQLSTNDCIGVITIWQEMKDRDLELRIGRLIQYAAQFGTADIMAFIKFCKENEKDPEFMKANIFHDLTDMDQPYFLPRTNGYASED